MTAVDPLTAGAYLFGTALGFFGAGKSASAARDQAEAAKEQAYRQLDFDNERYDMTAQKIKADHAWAVKETRYKRRNEDRIGNYKDANKAANYRQQLAIRNREQASLDAQYEKSEELFLEQVGFNFRSAKLAQESEWRKLEQINSEAAFTMQEQRLKNLVEEGKVRARGQSGRSVSKSHQAIAANFGQQVAALNEGLEGGARNTRSMIEQIKQDRYSANLSAYAQRMLDPGELPMPVVPFYTPRAEFLDPQPLQDFHFGPRPILGGYPSASAAAAQVWGSSISGIASNAVGFINALDL